MFQDTSSLQTPSITALDSNRTNFSNDIEALDNIGVRTCDTVHIFYVRSGQKTALEIVENVVRVAGLLTITFGRRIFHLILFLPAI